MTQLYILGAVVVFVTKLRNLAGLLHLLEYPECYERHQTLTIRRVLPQLDWLGCGGQLAGCVAFA